MACGRDHGRRQSGPILSAKRALRIAAVGLLAFALAYALYLAAANTILSTRILRRSVSGARLHLDYRSASSYWPGTIRFAGVRLAGEDPNVEWAFRFDDVRLSISLSELLRRRFHVLSAEGHGLEFHLRPKLAPGEATARRVAMMPPIPPLPPEPGRKGEAPAVAPSTPERLWTVVVDRLSAAPVREIWIDVYRYRGAATLRGGFRLHPKMEVAIGPATLEVRNGTLSMGDVLVASPPAGRVECRFSQFDPTRVRGAAVLSHLSARVHVAGPVASLAFLDHYFPAGPRWRSGGGPLVADLAVSEGRGSGHLRFDSSQARVTAPRKSFRGDVSLRARFSRIDFEQMRVGLDGSTVDARNVTVADEKDTSRAWWSKVDFVEGTFFGRGPLALSSRLDLRAESARPLYSLFSVSMPEWAKKVLTMENLRARATVRLGKTFEHVENLDATGEDFRVRGRLRREGSAARGAFLVESSALAVGVDVRPSGSKVKLIGAREWFETERP